VDTVADYTLPEKILLAAARLEETGQSPFSAEALIVSVWREHPRTFGLKGYEEHYPDSNKVLSGIMGEKGLPRRGWLAKVGQKLYALTSEGRQMVRHLLGEAPAPLPAPKASRGPRLTRPQDVLLQTLLASAVWSKLCQGRASDWTFSEAVKFWDLAERQGQAVDERLRELEKLLSASESELKEGTVQLGNGRSVTTVEVSQLIGVHEQLLKRFTRHLHVLRSRGDRSVG
jgi:hypothetical protein